ncbi:MAG: VOC family protein [Verrucomicrobia bacterium]|nr:VOC family protein [Verrucomicrobiota bacterium]MCH8514176.1 VOC family protein [Kiritimatiellia bacterium]
MKKATTHQPPEYHTVIPYLTVKDAHGLVDFLKTVFDAQPGECLNRPDGTIMHAEVRIGDSTVMLSEACEEMGPMPASLYVYVKDVDAAFKRAVDAGATPIMPPDDMFWGDRFCCVQDKWGNQWSPSTHIQDLSPEEIEQGSRAFMERMS